ncbi:retrovirus-related pol polyprotein from transposon TNT 1-94 [Tanacetum coccineum]
MDTVSQILVTTLEGQRDGVRTFGDGVRNYAEITDKEIKQMKAGDQAIQTILMGLPEDIYVAVDSCEMLRKSGYVFTSTDGESIESYYHRFLKLMNDFKRNKHFPEKIASNLKFLNNLQPEWRRHVEMQMVGGNGGNQFRQYDGQNVGNLNEYNVVQNVKNQNANQNGNSNVVAARAEGNGNRNNENQVRCYNCRGLCHYARNCIARPRRRDTAYLQTQLLIAQKEEAEIQLQAEEFDLMAAGDIDEIEEVNANYILMANLQQASTSGTQTDNASVYDSDGSAKVHHSENCYDNDIFNMFTQEEHSSVEQSGGTVDQHPATVEETRALYDSLYNNLVTEVEKFIIWLQRLRNSTSSAKMITTLNEEIANLNNQLSKEKSTVSYLHQEKKKLKSDFKIREDELLDKQIQLEQKIKELDNILVKMSQSIPTMHMLSPNQDFILTIDRIGFGLSKSLVSQASSADRVCIMAKYY